MALQSVSGSKIYIGRRVAPATDDLVVADFTGATWVEIDGWTSAGSLGDTQETVTQALINRGRVQMTKGTRTGGTMENTFVPLWNDPGQLAFKAAEASCSPYEFKVEWGAGCAPSGTVTMTIATPGVVTWAGGHGLEAGSPIVFSTNGALPTGVTAGTTYYVLPTDLTVTTFKFASTPGGTPIVTSGTQSGVHTADAMPAGTTRLFYGLAMPGAESGGDPNTAQLRTWSIAIDSNIVEI